MTGASSSIHAHADSFPDSLEVFDSRRIRLERFRSSRRQDRQGWLPSNSGGGERDPGHRLHRLSQARATHIYDDHQAAGNPRPGRGAARSQNPLALRGEPGVSRRRHLLAIARGRISAGRWRPATRSSHAAQGHRLKRSTKAPTHWPRCIYATCTGHEPRMGQTTTVASARRRRSRQYQGAMFSLSLRRASHRRRTELSGKCEFCHEIVAKDELPADLPDEIQPLFHL